MPTIDRINLTLKASKEVDGGQWKSVSLGAEATLNPNETFEMASQELYHQLASELRLLMATGTKKLPSVPQESAKGLPRQEAEPAVGDPEIEEPPAPVDPSWCAVHKTKMKLRNWGGHSHKFGGQWCQGHWCLQHKQPFKKFEKEGGTWWSHSYEDPDTGETLWCREDGEIEEIQS